MNKFGYRRILLVLSILAGFKGTAFSQTIDYKGIFGKDWERAEVFVSENEHWMKIISEKNNIPYSFAVALVFPELIRYSALRDQIEISLLKTLYVNLGEEYSDFSIGPFQMKPSFAEQIHQRIFLIKDSRIRKQFASRSSFRDPRLYRKSIVEGLEDLKSQFIYLVAFIKICGSLYTETLKDESEKLRFYATAYNCGLDKSTEFIKRMSDKKLFNTRLVKAETYSYSDISVYWFRKFKE